MRTIRRSFLCSYLCTNFNSIECSFRGTHSSTIIFAKRCSYYHSVYLTFKSAIIGTNISTYRSTNWKPIESTYRRSKRTAVRPAVWRAIETTNYTTFVFTDMST